MTAMKIWIVTPSYNMEKWLRIALRSVLNQVVSGIEVHHHVQDGGSSDGTVEMLKEHMEALCKEPMPGYTFSYESVPDEGMYDAINLGWQKMPVDGFDFVSYINCDEQYLPGTLSAIIGHFNRNPNAEVLMGDFIVLNEQMEYLCHKRSVVPIPWMAKFISVGSPCVTFLRTSAFRDKNLFFDNSWKIVGDVVWYKTMAEKKVKFTIFDRFLTAFIDLEGNLSESPASKEETERFKETFQVGWGFITPWLYRYHNLRRLILDYRKPAPSDIHVFKNERESVPLEILKPTFHWKRK